MVEIGWKLREVQFENLSIGNFAKCTEWPQPELQESDMTSTPHRQFLWSQVPSFHPFRSMSSRFQDIKHSWIFSLTSLLKFQSATSFKIGRLLRNVIACFPHGNQCPYKVLMRSVEICRRSNVFKFPAPYGTSCLYKISKCHNIFNFWQIAKK